MFLHARCYARRASAEAGMVTFVENLAPALRLQSEAVHLHAHGTMLFAPSLTPISTMVCMCLTHIISTIASFDV